MYRVQAFVAGIKDPEFDRLLLRLAAQHLVHKWHKCLNSKQQSQQTDAGDVLHFLQAILAFEALKARRGQHLVFKSVLRT